MRRFILLLLLGCATPTQEQPKTTVQTAWTPFNDPANRHHPERERAYDVLKYELRIKIYDTEPKIEGTATITLDRLKPGPIVLDAGEMTIRSVSLAGKNLPFRHEGEKLSVEPPDLPNGGVVLAIAYEARPRRGLFWVRPDKGYPEKPTLVWSQGETEYNHYWFPCYDYPNDRALTETWFTVPSKYTVISNGTLVEVKDEGNGWSTHHWKMDMEHVTYLVSVIVGEYEKYEDKFGDVPVQYYVPKGRFKKEDVLRSFAQTPAMLKFFSENIGTTYPYSKYAQTVVIDFTWGGMENISATTLYDYTVRSERESLDGDAEGLIAHELAHQWFGDLLACRSWAQIWLNEGFATYFAALWNESRQGKDGLMADMNDGAGSYFGEDAEYRRPVVCDVFTWPDDMFDSHTYPRGAWVLHMLRTLIGDAAWWKGIGLYVKRHARSVVETKDFRAAMEEASGRDLGWFFDQWLHAAGYPEFTVTTAWDETHRTLKLTVEQTQEATDRTFGPLKTGTPAVFKAPADLEVDGRRYRVWIDQRKQDFYFALDAEPKLVEFDCDGSILKKLTFKKSALQLVYQLQNDDGSAGRIWAAGELASATDDLPAVVAALKKTVLEDKVVHVRIAAANALAKLKGDAPRLALLDAAVVKEARVRRAVLAALGEWANDEGVQMKLLASMETDESYACQSAAALSYGRAGAKAYNDILKFYRERESNPWVAPAFLQALVETNELRVMPELVKASAYGKHPRLRGRAVDQLARKLKDHGDEEAFTALLKLLEDPAFHIRGAAISALGAIGDARAVPALEVRAKEEFDARMRKDAADAIRKIKK